MPRHIVCLTFDFDTESGFIARGLTTPTMLSRGEFGLTGARRILDLAKSRGIPMTWFVPGFTIESHRADVDRVVEGGHEIAHHSWAHVPPAEQSRDEEEEDMIRANEAIKELTGRKASGYRSPSWDLSENTLDLLEAQGFDYDSSLMAGDYIPMKARRKDTVKLGEPIQYGEDTSLIEMPISWTLDDHPHFEYLRTPGFLMPGLRPARGDGARLGTATPRDVVPAPSRAGLDRVRRRGRDKPKRRRRRQRPHARRRDARARGRGTPQRSDRASWSSTSTPRAAE